ncbi:MAG: outer membrane lipoprotein carrier protein LolA [Myxococcales bacterium]|nr:outer membrane lipoprotein carrier protein LolA [Myxococcales bacterium]
MRTSRRAVLAAAAMLALPRGAAGEDDLGDVIRRVAAARAPIRTLRGPFEQTRTIGLLSTEVRSRGTLTLVRPDRLRWALGPPDDVTFWVGPEGFAYRGQHGGGKLPASSARIGAALADLRTLLGDDLGKLRERWELHVLRRDADGVELDAVPRPGSAARLQRIRFSLAPDLARPRQVTLIEGPRDRTLITFGELATNVAVDEASMRSPE